jgi:hypothetical protein
MAIYTKIALSGLGSGIGLLISQTATAGNTFHESHATSIDEVWLWATNAHTETVDLTVEWGDVTDPGDTIVTPIPPDEGLILVIPGLTSTGTKTLAAFASVTNVVTVFGYANRIT